MSARLASLLDGKDAQAREGGGDLAPSPTRLTIEERREVVSRMREEGSSVDEIAEAVSMSTSTVRKDLAALEELDELEEI